MTLTEAIAVAAEAREIGLLSRFPKAACVLADEVARLRIGIADALHALEKDAEFPGMWESSDFTGGSTDAT